MFESPETPGALEESGLYASVGKSNPESFQASEINPSKIPFQSLFCDLLFCNSLESPQLLQAEHYLTCRFYCCFLLGSADIRDD